jgi:hypothetical protein
VHKLGTVVTGDCAAEATCKLMLTVLWLQYSLRPGHIYLFISFIPKDSGKQSRCNSA